jgi:hypothetical protein
MPTLETTSDKDLEAIATERYVNCFSVPLQVVHTLAFSNVDKLAIHNGHAVMAFEIKTRKQSAQQIRQYPEGLLIKARKVEEMQQIARLLNVTARIVFAFDNAHGEIWECQTEKLPELPQHTPKPRSNFRDLACDLDPVCYLQWEQHLKRVA